MNLKSTALLLAAIMLASNVIIPAEAAGKKKDASAVGAATPMATMAPLTASECERLGGTVNDLDTNCRATGTSCTTKTLNNGTHTACITEAN